MEKSLNLIKNKIVSLSKINFNGFSSSSKWIGYFEAKDISDFSLIFESSKLVKFFFKEEINNFFLLSSLTFDDDRVLSVYPEDVLLHFNELYLEVKQNGFLTPYEGLMEQYYESNDDSVMYPANLLTLTFNSSKLFDYCELVMAYNKIFGEICFLINPSLSIALYPHSEKGYGCISLNDNVELLKDFLEFCKKDDRFNVVIEN